MREIKFRAWDKEHKTMKIPNEIDFLVVKAQSINWKMQGCMSDLWLNNESESYCPIEVELMQFTGLKDRNGKEIYEGDIVKTTSELMTNYGQDRTGKYKTEYFSIEYDTENAKWKERRLADNWLAPLGISQDIISKYSEVIGNIYENPELLEQAK